MCFGRRDAKRRRRRKREKSLTLSRGTIRAYERGMQRTARSEHAVVPDREGLMCRHFLTSCRGPEKSAMSAKARSRRRIRVLSACCVRRPGSSRCFKRDAQWGVFREIRCGEFLQIYMYIYRYKIRHAEEADELPC